MQFHSKKLILFAVLASSFLISCHKKDHLSGDPVPPQPDPPVFTGPLVKTLLDQAGTNTFTYDTKNRVINTHTDYDNSSKDYTYTDTSVILKRYNRDGLFQGALVYRLNAKKLAISMSDTAGLGFDSYTYNNANQLIRTQTDRVIGGQIYSFDKKYFYSNKDLDSTTEFASNTGQTIVTYYKDYDLTKINTVGTDNFGLSFLGSASKHPVKKTTLKSGDVLYDYVYTYDADGKITQEDITIAGGALQLPFVFTYY